MVDIVELMRAGRVCDDKCRVMEAKSGCLCAEAADEIERLRAALARIDKMEAYYYEDSRDVLYSKIGIMRDIARAALETREAGVSAKPLEEK